MLLGAVQFVVLARHDRDELWSDYLSLPPGSVDVLFLGTSLVHANINPTVMWESTGIRAYNLSGSEQSLLTTLPYLDEALRTQKPRVVALDLHMFSLENTPLSENQKRSNLTMMPLGLPKLRAIVTATPAQEWTRYLIPLEQFHSRWGELGKDDFNPKKWQRHREDLFLGYRKVVKVEPQRISSERRELDEDLYTRNYRVLSQIIERAESSGAEVLLLVGPSSRPSLHDEWIERLEQDLATGYPNVKVLETQRRIDEMNVVYESDYYDALHLNAGGAEKYSTWLGLQLSELYGLPRSGRSGSDDVWRRELERYRGSLSN